MEFSGIFKGTADAKEGVSANGNAWRKVTGVFETVEHYPKTIAVDCMNAMGETLAQCVKGRLYRVRFDVESREYNGKWYTNCKAWGIQAEAPAATPGTHDDIQTTPVTSGGSAAGSKQPVTKDPDLPF